MGELWTLALIATTVLPIHRLSYLWVNFTDDDEDVHFIDDDAHGLFTDDEGT